MVGVGQSLWNASHDGDNVEMARLLNGGPEPDAFITVHDDAGAIYQSTTHVRARGLFRLFLPSGTPGRHTQARVSPPPQLIAS